MPKAKKNSAGGLTWTFEFKDGTPLSTKLDEMMTIFNHYSARPAAATADIAFVMQLLTYQAEELRDEAKRAEKEMAELKKEIAAMKKDIAELKDPPSLSLDKAAPHLGLKKQKGL